MNVLAVEWLTLVRVVCTVIVSQWIQSDAAAVRRRVEPLDHPERSEGSIRKVRRGGGCGGPDQEGRRG